MTDRIELTDARDKDFAKMAQGAIVKNTVLPSGYKTPDTNMIIDGEALVTAYEMPRENRDIFLSAPSKRYSTYAPWERE